MEVPLKHGGLEIFKKLFILTIVSALNSGMELMDREELYSEYASPIATSAYTTTFIHDGREYTLSSTKTSWNEAKFICQSWNSTLAILDDFEKALYLAEALAETDHYMESVWIGSRKDSETNSYYWITSRKALPRMQSNMWNPHQVQRPSDQSSFPVWLNRTDPSMSEQGADCVAMQRGHHDEPIFVDLYCNSKRGFACEKAADSNLIPPEIGEVVEVQCGITLYKIFTAKTVWEEAVGICNSYGMSLATFNSVRCLEKIGSKMMKMRPSLENAWIGGKGEGGEWSWLSTGEPISESGMQNSQDPLQEKWPPFRERAHLKSQGCLMVDRQVCNETVFLEARCNRVNNFICQMDSIVPHPPKENDTEENRNLFLHESPDNYYALIPEKLPYSGAIRYCKMLNGSLASLTEKDMLVHLLRTMELANQKPIKHIWVSGNLVQDPSTGQLGWTDPNTGMPLPGSEGNLPWCEDEEVETEEACLNLDRESMQEAVIYGMPCDTKQNFVCVIAKFEKSSEPSGSKLQIPTSSVFQQQVQQTPMNGQQPNGPPPFGGQNPPPFGGQQPPSFGVQKPPLFGSLPQQSFPSQQPLQKPPQYVEQQQPSGLPQLMPSVMRKTDFPERSNSPTANLPNSYGPAEFSD